MVSWYTSFNKNHHVEKNVKNEGKVMKTQMDR